MVSQSKDEFLQTFSDMLSAAFEMQANSVVDDPSAVTEAALRLHRLGGKLNEDGLSVVVGVLIMQWAMYVSRDPHFMHPEEAIDFMIGKMAEIL